jgi:glycosyltransferase involved in cell wall biosynthesis
LLWRRYVHRYYPLAELLQAINEHDARALAAMLGRAVEVRPPLVMLPEHAVAPRNAGACAVFLGDYGHHPNPEAAKFLAREVWPRVRAERPEARLRLIGPRADRSVLALGQLPGVDVVGFVPELTVALGGARCMVAPVFSGGGSRIKVLTALAHGLPVVANQLALAGIDPPVGATCRAETAPELAKHVLHFLADADAAAMAGAAARRWAETTLDARHLAREQLERFEALLTEHRKARR